MRGVCLLIVGGSLILVFVTADSCGEIRISPMATVGFEIQGLEVAISSDYIDQWIQ